MITAQEINEKQFHDAWRGYNQEEVDDFLDQVAEAITALQRENEALRRRVSELDEKIEASKTSEEMLRKTLESAQIAAEEAIATARAKADEIVRDAEERAQKARDELKMRVETAEDEVRRRTEAIEQEQEGRRHEIQESVDRLQAFETGLKVKLQSFFEQQRTLLQTLEERTDRSIEIGDERVPDATFDPVDEAPDTNDLVVEAVPKEAAPVLGATGPMDAVEDAGEPSLDDFGPFDEEVLDAAPKRRRGLFHRREKDVEVSSEEV